MKITVSDLASKSPFPQWRFLQLMLVFFFWMLVYPRLERIWVAHLVLQLLMLDLLLVTIWANPHWPDFRKPLVVFLLMSVGASLIAILPLPPTWARVNSTVQGVLHLPILAACALGVLSFVFRSERPTPDGIFATIVAYLLVAIMFSQLYMIVLAWNPEALHLTVPLDQLTPQARAGQVLYFSVVTLSTVGYGDILPTAEITRTMAAIEAIAGQFYVAVIVAVFVGMYIAQAQDEIRSRRERSGHDH